MAGLLSLATKLSQTTMPVPSAAYLITLDPKTDAPLVGGTLQYFPDSLSDSKAVSWQAKEIPGGSLPMYQWTGSGERSISFTARFSCDVDLITKAAQNTPGQGQAVFDNLSMQPIRDRLQNTGQTTYNVDIRSAVTWLRSHILPDYNDRGEPIAPPKLILFIPNSGIGLSGGDVGNFQNQPDAIVCVMTSCEVTYDSFFPSGLPRLASVNLAFSQIPQYKGTIRFPASKIGTYSAAASTSMQGAIRGVALAGAPKYLGYETKYDASYKVLTSGDTIVAKK